MIPYKAPALVTIILVLSVAYFSWLPSPALSESPLLPKWLSNWADEHYNLRTAIPFLGIGFMGGLSRRYLLTLMLCFALASFVEIGQLLLPKRTFDLEDIMYAMLGTLMGLLGGFSFPNRKQVKARKSSN